jgi:hypothetical protein
MLLYFAAIPYAPFPWEARREDEQEVAWPPLDLSDQYRKLPHRVRPRSMTNLYNLLVQIDLTILKSTL